MLLLTQGPMTDPININISFYFILSFIKSMKVGPSRNLKKQNRIA